MTALLNKRLTDIKARSQRAFLEKAKATEGAVLLTAGEPDFGISDGVRIHLSKSIEHGKTHYASPEGDYFVRRAIVDYENRVTGAVYSTDEVIVTVGASEGLYLAFQTILNPGDEVIIPMPAVSLYETDVHLAGGVPVFLDTSKDEFQIDAEKLNALVTDKTKAILINSPNNPTGVVYTEESVRAVAEAVKDRPIFVLCDDAYCHVYFGGNIAPAFHTRFPELRDRTLVIKSLSNSNALPGFRIGYIFGPEDVIAPMKTLHSAMVTSVVSLFQDPIVETCHTGIAGMMEAYKGRRDYVYERLEAMGIPHGNTEGTFYVLADIRRFGMGAEEFCQRMLEEAGVAVMPGTCYGIEGYVRISTAAMLSQLKMGMGRMETFVAGLK